MRWQLGKGRSRSAPLPSRGTAATFAGAGRDLFFEEVQGLAPGASGKTKKIASDENGVAQVPWQFPGTALYVEMEVRYLDERQRPSWSDRDQGRVFFWSAGGTNPGGGH